MTLVFLSTMDAYIVTAAKQLGSLVKNVENHFGAFKRISTDVTLCEDHETSNADFADSEADHRAEFPSMTSWAATDEYDRLQGR